jgi:hypothetical protein
MSKIKRSVLKQLIKECLVEILVEGINSESGVASLVEAARPRPSSGKNSKMERIQKNRDLLDSKKVAPPAINDSVINNFTSDPIMAEILRDTASTTLMTQGMSNSSMTARPGQSAEALAVANGDLEQLFEGSQNWATLAFEKP